MAPRLLSRQALRAVGQTARPTRQYPSVPRRVITRQNSSNNYDKLPEKKTPGPGPNSESLRHVTEEAEMMGKITGDPSAPTADQGTPVAEILKRDPELKESAPEVLKDAVNSKKPSGTRSYSTLVQRSVPEDKFFQEVNAEAEYINAPGRQHAQLVPDQSEPTSYLTDVERFQGKEEPRHKFGMPDKSKVVNIGKRYDDIVQQMSTLMIKHGKKSKAESNVIRILNNLKVSRPPVMSSARPLLPGAPPANHLPLNPVLYLSLAIDSIAPLVRMRSIKGAAGGGRALAVPVPLEIRARRRLAIGWILDAAAKKPFRGSGKGGLAQKITDELIAIIEGKSSLWLKRTEVHKAGVLARSNLKSRRR